MKPFFSVVIPTLNEEKFISKLLDNLVKQKEKNFEVIVIDSQSKDKTRVIINNYKDVLPIHFFQAKTNVSQARNYGAKKAEGEYLIFLDADAQIYSNFTQILKKSIEKTKGLFFIPAIIPDENNIEMDLTFRIINYLVEFSQNLKKPFSTGGSMVVEKNLFYRIGGFNETLFLSEDHNLVQKAQIWGVRAKFLPKLKLKFSMRRSRKEGRLILFYKYLVTVLHMFLKGDLKEKIFNYQMGGALYNYKKLNKKTFLNNDFNRYLKLLRKFFEKQLT